MAVLTPGIGTGKPVNAAASDDPFEFTGVDVDNSHDDNSDPKNVSAEQFGYWLQNAMLKLLDVAAKGGVAVPVRNETGATITKGTDVYISSWSSAQSRGLIDKADANYVAKRATFVLKEDITHNANGRAYPFSDVTGLDTSGAAAVGSKVYLSGTPGAFVYADPAGATVICQEVGVVTIKHATTGAIRFYPGAGVFTRQPVTLADNSVAAAKLAATGQYKIFGRESAGAGAGEEIAFSEAGVAMGKAATATAQQLLIDVPNINNDVTVNDPVTLDAAAFGKVHIVKDDKDGAAQYDVTLLAAAAGNKGRRIAFLGDSNTNLTRAIRVVPNGAQTIGGAAWMMIVPDRFVVIESDGANWVIVWQNDYKLSGNLTISLDNSMSNALINQYFAFAPKDLNLFTLTYSQAAGTYATSQWVIKGFRNGNITLSGDGNSAAHVNQDRILSGVNGNPIITYECEPSCAAIIMGIRFDVPNVNASIGLDMLSGYVLCIGCYFNGAGTTTTSYGVLCEKHGICFSYQNYFQYLTRAMSAVNGGCIIQFSSYTQTNNSTYILFASSGIIYQSNNTLGGGSSGVSGGGEIRTAV